MTHEFRRQLGDMLARVEREDLISRIWMKDHTVWDEDPTEISDRLGWLELPRAMPVRCGELQRMAGELVRDGTRHVVLLGMGGSSLAPEVFARTFPPAPDHPELIVLDSTHPGTVRSVRERIEPEKTLFIVSSKSGSTIEPSALMAYFWEETMVALTGHPGRGFMALTDPSTSLVALAKDRDFRWVVENRPDIGGRYAALSMVGLVPAAFLGMDVDTLLERAGLMADACGPGVPAPEHPAVALATAMAAGFASGRDKLTVWASHPISSFTLWLEQLVAESLGKDGKGVIPVVGEPLLADDLYGDDRVFVKLSLAGEERLDAKMDAALDRLGERGHPTLIIDLEDPYDLGAQFVLWEFATALAGALMGVRPFDQPDVEEAKVEARKALERYQADLIEPDVGPCALVSELLKQARPGDYVAIMAFVDPTPEADRALAALRKRITEESGLATTLGYGPRFLHSTGQLHKGGTNNVLCLQLVSEGDDLEVPGAGYTFGVLAKAQAAGDLAALRARGRRVARWCVQAREDTWSSPS